MAKKNKGTMVAVIFLVSLPGLAHAVSFDCAKASTTVEKLVCADPGLGKLDDQLSASYKKRMAAVINRAGVRAMQQDWLKLLNRDCKDAACARKAYQDQVANLDSFAQEEFSANYKTATENSLTASNETADGFDFSLVQSNLDSGEAFCRLPAAEGAPPLHAKYASPDVAEFTKDGCTLSFKIGRGTKTDSATIDVSSTKCEKLCPKGEVFDDHYLPSYEPVAEMD